MVAFRYSLTAGSTTSAAGVIDISLPVTAAAVYITNSTIGTGWVEDSGTNNFLAFPIIVSTTTFKIYLWSATSTYVSSAAAVANNVPWGSIASGDRIQVDLGCYEAA